MNDTEFEAYARDSVRELHEKIESLRALNDFTSVARWECDLHQVPGTLKFLDKNGKLIWICDVIEIGSFSRHTSSWEWAWATDTLPAEAREQAIPLKELQQITGKDFFGFGTVSADETFAWQLAAMSVKHLSALSCYDGPIDDGRLVLLFAIFNIRPGT